MACASAPSIAAVPEPCELGSAVVSASGPERAGAARPEPPAVLL